MSHRTEVIDIIGRYSMSDRFSSLEIRKALAEINPRMTSLNVCNSVAGILLELEEDGFIERVGGGNGNNPLVWQRKPVTKPVNTTEVRI